mmetsp:Transcript_15724/g.51348  ORF Transcript_15724/g.51348 Transcript_15724/m.51348 type:complete len:312 (+) Transcript_15724:2185-3120(+)
MVAVARPRPDAVTRNVSIRSARCFVVRSKRSAAPGWAQLEVADNVVEPCGGVTCSSAVFMSAPRTKPGTPCSTGAPDALSTSALDLGPSSASCSRSAKMRVSAGASVKEVGVFHGAVSDSSGMPFLPSVAGHGVWGLSAKDGYVCARESLTSRNGHCRLVAQSSAQADDATHHSHASPSPESSSMGRHASRGAGQAEATAASAAVGTDAPVCAKEAAVGERGAEMEAAGPGAAAVDAETRRGAAVSRGPAWSRVVLRWYLSRQSPPCASSPLAGVTTRVASSSTTRTNWTLPAIPPTCGSAHTTALSAFGG